MRRCGFCRAGRMLSSAWRPVHLGGGGGRCCGIGPKTVAKNSAPCSHFLAAFAAPFPGFGHDGTFPELENVDELNALEQFSIERSGSVVMTEA